MIRVDGSAYYPISLDYLLSPCLLCSCPFLCHRISLGNCRKAQSAALWSLTSSINSSAEMFACINECFGLLLQIGTVKYLYQEQSV